MPTDRQVYSVIRSRWSLTRAYLVHANATMKMHQYGLQHRWCKCAWDPACLLGWLVALKCHSAFNLPGTKSCFTKPSLGTSMPLQCYLCICRADLAWSTMVEASDFTGDEVYSETPGKNKESTQISSQMCCC